VQGGVFVFYDNFIRACNSVGKTPSAVLLELGIGKSANTRWKNGHAPTDAILQKLADYFKITKEELLGKKERPSPEGDERPECWDLLTREEREKAREYIEMLIAARGKR
jgi:transcriptional regulator with XRE-family HTH domain